MSMDETDSKDTTLRINESKHNMMQDLDMSQEYMPTQATTNDASFEAAHRERSLTSHPQLSRSGEEEHHLVDPIVLAQLNHVSKDDQPLQKSAD